MSGKCLTVNFTFQSDEARIFGPDVSFLLNSLIIQLQYCQGNMNYVVGNVGENVREFWSILYVWTLYCYLEGSDTFLEDATLSEGDLFPSLLKLFSCLAESLSRLTEWLDMTLKG